MFNERTSSRGFIADRREHLKPLNMALQIRDPRVRSGYSALRDVCFQLAGSSPASRRNVFLLVAQGRSGGTFLNHLIDSHPNVCCESEILSMRPLFPLRYLKGRAALKRSSCSSWGCRGKVAQLDRFSRGRSRALLEALVGQGGRIIYLFRRNVVKQALSMEVGIQRNCKWHRQVGESAVLPKVTVDLKRLAVLLAACVRNQSAEEQLLSGLPLLRLIYEDHLLNPQVQQQTMTIVYEYLGVRDHHAEASLRKTGGGDPSQDIENWEEVNNEILRRGLGSFLVSP